MYLKLFLKYIKNVFLNTLKIYIYIKNLIY